MELARFEGLEWIKGEGRHLVQGVKGNRRPRGAMYGGHGSFMVRGTPAELILTVSDVNGKKRKIDVIDVVKRVNGWQNLSDKRVNTLTKELRQKGDIDMSNLNEELMV